MNAIRHPLLLLAAPAILLALSPASQGALIYDRAALAQGELWRLWTGHWVHFSSAHLGWNLLVLLVAGTRLEQLRPGWLVHYTLLAAPLISLGLLWFAPDMQTYGGLSGLATGVVVLLALAHLAGRQADRPWCIGLLALVAAKTGLDAIHGATLFSGLDAGMFHSSALSHALGIGLGLVFFLSHPLRLCLPLGSDLAANPVPPVSAS